MKELTLRLPGRSYPIVIAESFTCLPDYLKRLIVENYACIITNSRIKSIFGNAIVSFLEKSDIGSHFFCVKDSELSKSFETAFFLIEKILKIDKKKKIFIVALGGGVVGDLAGFVAAVYKRGIPFVQIPTTLLAQVDSSIGGKVAVDVKEAKNIIGAFYQPKLVYINLATGSTLPQREIQSGLAEVIKYGMIKDKSLFELLEDNMESLLKREPSVLEEVIFRCAHIKAKIVEEDENEKKGKRTILNFGHTFGHAIETASSYVRKFSHGQAVGVGMLMACDLAVSLNFCSYSVRERLENVIKRAGLPVCVTGLSLEDILSSMQYDKKFIHGKNKFVLPLKVGRVEIVEDVSDDKIKKACEGRLK